MNRRAAGARAEEMACAYLIGDGYEILARNVRLGRGEIDIVAQKGDVVAFVEVKARSTARFGTPAEAVTREKMRRIISAATAYAAAHDLFDWRLRFDVVELAAGKIRHIESAFDLTNASI